MLRFFADDVDHVIDRDTAEQNIVLIDDRRGHPVMVGELTRDFIVRFVDVNRWLIMINQLVDRRRRLRGQQRCDRQTAHVLVTLRNNEQVVSVIRQFAAQTQVTQHDVNGGIGTHGDDIRIHQTAGSVFVIRQNLLQPFPIIAVHRTHDFVHHGLWQIFNQIRQIVDVEIFNSCDQFVLVHVCDQTFSDLITNVQQNLTIIFRINETPDDDALGRRKRFKKVADLSRRQRLNEALDRSQATTVDCV